MPLNFPVQASVPPLSGVFQQCIARRTKRLTPCPMHATTIPAHHEGNGFDLLFLVQVLKSFLFYMQLAKPNRLVEEKAGHLYAVCLLPDAKARRHAGLSAAEVSFTKAKLEKDDGLRKYEIEFIKGSTEYEYEIDAATGSVLEYDVERSEPAPSNDNRQPDRDDDHDDNHDDDRDDDHDDDDDDDDD